MYPTKINRLIEHFKKLPTVGPKTAERLVFKIIKDWSLPEVELFAATLLEAKRSVRTCQVCQNISETDICGVCSNPKRNPAVICVVTDEKSQLAIEKSGEFNGTYHILGGLLSPIDGNGIEQLNINSLMNRVKDHSVEEVIFALPPKLEGDTTIIYLGDILKPFVSRVSRISFGIPVGGELEYADQLTISRALSDRRTLE